MDKLLICICFHYIEDRFRYLDVLMDRFLNEYTSRFNVTVIVDTNSKQGEMRLRERYPDDRVGIFRHDRLAHPFHLTWMHRYHISLHKDEYDFFMYVEDDMDIPLENFVRYLENFRIVWPRGVPVFLRVEEKDGVRYNSDAERREPVRHLEILKDREFVTEMMHPLPYHAFWICPGDVLRSIMPPDFVKCSISRETAASFLIWEMRKKGYLQWEDGNVSRKCLAYHLPNNYACDPHTRLGKIPLDNVFFIDKRDDDTRAKDDRSTDD